MANTYSQLNIQLVFAVRGRQSLIHPSWKGKLYQYITGILQQRGHKMLQINGMPDHLHIFFGYHPSERIPDLVNQIKTYSGRFIKEEQLSPYPFTWQKGYGAFSYGQSQRAAVIRYIAEQERHHRRVTFREEYTQFLKKFEMDYKEEYLFDFQDINTW